MPRDVPARRALLVGWESADWRIVQPLVEAGRMPRLAGLIENGVMGPLHAPPPFACPILWTTMVTGVLGDRHGILTFMEPDGAGDVRPVESTSRRHDPLWTLLDRTGRASLVIGWPVSHPAETIKGVVVSERFAHATGAAAELWPADQSAFQPPRLLEPLMPLRLHPASVSRNAMTSFVPGLTDLKPDDPRLQEIAAAVARAGSVHNAATWAMQNAAWDFAAVHYDLSGLGRGFAVTGGPKPELFENVAAAAMDLLDRMLGRLIDLAGQETFVFVASDHGVSADGAPERRDRRPSQTETSAILRRHGRRGIFVASGPGSRRDEFVFGARLADVAPTVLAALGVATPAKLDGRVLESVFETPPEFTVEVPPPKISERRPDPWVVQETLEDLATLVPQNASIEAAAAIEAATHERLLNLAQVHTLRRRFDLAADTYRELLDRDDSHQVRIPLVECLIRLDRLDAAEIEMAPLPADAPDSDLVLMMRARIHLKRGDHGEASGCLERIAGFDDAWIRAPLPLGFLALKLKRWTQAAHLFDLALVRGSEMAAGAHHGKGAALLRLGRNEESLSHHLAAIRLAPGETVFQLHYGIAAARAGRMDEARSGFERALALNPQNASARRWLARLPASENG